MKLQIFGTKGAGNFENFKNFKDNRLFWTFKGKFGQILINIVILDYFGYKNNSFFFDFEKVEKISGNFREILGNFSKKIVGHKTPNFENFRKFFLKNAIKHYLWGT